MSRALTAAVSAAAAVGAAPSAYNALLVAAASVRREPPRPDTSGLHLLALVPAHDEQHQIAQTVRALIDSCASPHTLDVTVVADNCSDRTAQEATAAGARVLERTDPDNRGKGRALAWALERLGDHPADAVLFVDADCQASPTLAKTLADELAAGADAVQADYVVSNAGDSGGTALRFAAFALACTARPGGRSRLGASAGLLGTGMAIRRDVLRRLPWTAFGLAEDQEYHLRLVDSGARVGFVPEAAVFSPMPSTHTEGAGQQARWEAGRVALRRPAARLVASGLRRGDRVRLHAGLELLLPPQSLVAAGGAAALALGVLTGRRAATAVATAGLIAQVGAIAGALRLAGAPASVYRALGSAPLLIARKVRLYGEIAAGRGPQGWERTVRQPKSDRAGSTPGAVNTKSLT